MPDRTSLHTVNQGLLTALEYIRDHLEPRPREAEAREISPLEDAAYQCQAVAEAAVNWAKATAP